MSEDYVSSFLTDLYTILDSTVCCEYTNTRTNYKKIVSFSKYDVVLN